MKRISTHILCFGLSVCLLINTAHATKVSVPVAAKCATAFITGMLDGTVIGDGISASDLLMTGTFNGLETYYVFGFSENGFIIISADDQVYPVLAYSATAPFDPYNLSPEFSLWMDQYNQQIYSVVSQDLQAGIKESSAWTALAAGNLPSGAKGVKSMDPLLMSTWDQGSLYNYYCPLDPGGPGGRVWAGCVATAMSQVMYYYRYPAQGFGSHGYNSSYGYLYADFSSADYEWDVMQNNIGGQYNFEMAEIQYHCGIAIDMMYSPSGSGAYMNDDRDAMVYNFGYSNTSDLLHRDNYSESTWTSMLRGELDLKRPLQYAGYGPGGGHAFVCDGYQGSDFFHFNWGWGGYYNGYFYLDNLNPGSTFNDGQQAIFYSYPAASYPEYCTGTKTLTSQYGTIADGSGPQDNYQNNSECYWLIQPDLAVDYITLNFNSFSTQSGHDILTVYDGSSTTDSVLGVFSGNNLPSTIVSTGKAILLRFASDGSVSGQGWFLTYTSKLTRFCEFLTELTDSSGYFSDGSDAYNYNNTTQCYWRIIPPGVTAITISFTNFDLETDDFVKIYDEAHGNDLITFTGDNIPQSFTAYTGDVLVLFKTNFLFTSAGWDAVYTSTTSGISENENVATISVYPNPVVDHLTISLAGYDQGNVSIDIMTASGQLACNRSVECGSDGSGTLSLNVSSFASGVYFLRVSSARSSIVQKLMVH